MALVWLLGAAAAVWLLALSVWLAPLSPGLVSLQLTFSADAFQRVLLSWSADDLARVRWHFVADTVLLALYACFGFLWARRSPAAQVLRRRWRLAAMLALPLAALADLTENLLHQHLLDLPAGATAAAVVYLAAGLAASLKWALCLVFALLAVAARRGRIRQRQQRRH